MSDFPKLEPKLARQTKKAKTAKTEAVEPSPTHQHDINYVHGLGGVEASLDFIARALYHLNNPEHEINLSLGQGFNVNPVKITLADNDFDDTMDRLVIAVERIADSLAKMAGLTRPRLESWHEQSEYTPRYRDQAENGGAPGPPTK